MTPAKKQKNTPSNETSQFWSHACNFLAPNRTVYTFYSLQKNLYKKKLVHNKH